MPASSDHSTVCTSSAEPKAVLVAVPPHELDDEHVRASLAELHRLLTGLGVCVVAEIIQRRSSAAHTAVLGAGKLRELAALTGGPGVVPKHPKEPTEEPAVASEPAIANLVVVDAELTPGQHRHLEQALGVEILDRTGTILEVFDRRARTPEARLEVEIARLIYETPRARDASMFDDREGGGGRGERGHSNVELAKRRLHHRVAALRRELQTARAVRLRARERRQHTDRVALVGYTNAGKSSLMRALTGSEVLVDDQLFATLDTTVRAIPDTTPRILVCDTVGFLDHLPHDLIASFRSTLDEAGDAGLLLYVVDASDPRMREHLRVTKEVLADLGASSIPSLLVLSKIDRVDSAQRDELRLEFPHALLVSSHDRSDVARVRTAIVEALEEGMTDVSLEIPYEQGSLLGEIRTSARVLGEAYGETGVTVTVRAPRPMVDRFERALGGG